MGKSDKIYDQERRNVARRIVDIEQLVGFLHFR